MSDKKNMSETTSLRNQRIDNMKHCVTPTFKVKTKQTNDLGYYEMDAKSFRPMGDRILVQWEFHNDEISAGKITLLRPEQHKKMKYTGVVISVGPSVTSEINPGDRLLFDQFSNFEKFFDQELGRLALLSEKEQASAFAIIPARAKVGEGQGDYNYDR